MSKQKTVTPIGTFIKMRRKERDLTQKQLAFHAEVSFTLVNRIENGDLHVQVDSLNKLLRIFGYELGPLPMNQDLNKTVKGLENGN